MHFSLEAGLSIPSTDSKVHTWLWAKLIHTFSFPFLIYMDLETDYDELTKDHYL